MSIHDRVLVVVYCIVVALCSLLALFFALGWEAPSHLLTSAVATNSLLTGLIAFLVFMASIRLLILFVARQRSGATLVYPGELGEVRISLLAMENLVRKVAGGVSGVKEVKASAVLAQDKLLSIKIQVAVGAEVNIPNLSAHLQKTIADHLLAVVGVTVEDVHVLVTNIADSPRRGRVE